MIKISALNKETEEEPRSEEEVTKEALEQIALQQYAKALDLQRKGNLPDATQLLKDLLETELLDGIKKPAPGEKIVGPLFNLKYLCHKNLGSMLGLAGDVKGAIEEYCGAVELDDTDVTLWHRLGVLCMHAQRYEMALQVFQRGADCNPKHWPCLDKIITLLLGLDSKEECIAYIYDALKLDPDYLRGLAYRKHIYTNYRYVRDYMEYLDPIYKWNEKDDEPVDEKLVNELIKEAEMIHETFVSQQKAQQLTCTLPTLKLEKPISMLSWESVGVSIVHMHQHITDKCLSHACHIELVFKKEEKEMQIKMMEDPPELIEAYHEEIPVYAEKVVEKVSENVSENENNDYSDKDKTPTDTEKVESDVELVAAESAIENIPEPTKKKPPARRRGSALSFLEQWEWCTKRRSSRKKPLNRQDHLNNNIYDTLRRMVPACLATDIVEERENGEQAPCNETAESTIDQKIDSDTEYFGSENEQREVNDFINKYTENKKDIIDMLNNYLNILAEKWKMKWPENLAKIFTEANKCYNNHIDVPAHTDDNSNHLNHYTNVNLLVEELSVNEKLHLNTNEKQSHDLSVIEVIGLILSQKPHIFVSNDILNLMLRYIWVKLHIHILNKNEECALDCLYQLSNEFEAMGEHCGTYNLTVINFTFKPVINENEISAYIKFLERNKQLSTVLELFDRGCYEDVLIIVIDSFEHCKNKARQQEEEMSLDFAVQLSLILDTYWALDQVENCFKWSLICLHEALKHYFRFTSGSPEYEKWTLTAVKILCCMEHILTTEGLSSLDSVSQRELSQGLEDLIRIIGHQMETSAADMPFGTVIPWIIMHYILQRAEDQGRGRAMNEHDKMSCDDVPNPLMVLFIAHEQLGNRNWCCKSDGKLLYFILDTVVPRLRSPALAKSLEQVCQHMEQCVYCLFGHPCRKNKVKYLVDHNAPTFTLDWKRAQQLYEIFRPLTLPELESKLPAITSDTEQLFLRILDLLPAESHPQKYVPEIEKYIKGTEVKLPLFPPILPYKMKDIFYLLGDYYFKKEVPKMGIKYNMYDVIVNNDRLESWAEISLEKAFNLVRILNSCKNLDNEKEFLTPAKSVIRCFKRSLELDPTHCTMWIEYGMFVYVVHSFCSRLLKQASESLSMEDFESLEKQKEDMLDTTHKCFMAVLVDDNNSNDIITDDSWLHYYMLGKVAEKRNKPPSVYLDFYMQGVKRLQDTDATYPLKINYSSPTTLCIEVLELHYRIHASILKYIEQHESKPIPSSVGKVFANCIEKWKHGPFMKQHKKDAVAEVESDAKSNDHIHAANILKRSVSDAGEEDNRESKRMKLESAAAKVKRSASYDTEALVNKDPPQPLNVGPTKDLTNTTTNDAVTSETKKQENKLAPIAKRVSEAKNSKEANASATKPHTEKDKDPVNGKKSESSSSSSSSSSESSSSSSSSESSSDSDSDTSVKSTIDKPLPDDEIMKIVSDCLDALEDCASRFPPHYKAIYRLTHYHFYYKRGKDIERCRDLMLSNFTARTGQKLGGLFSERKPSNFFNNIWKIPVEEIDRAGGFAFHMNRSVLLTMEILKEIDDHKTLLDLSLHLQRIPEPDKKYLRDSDREELAQQAFSLCVQSLKGQLLKFSQQSDLKSNDVERQALKSLMLDIYRAYQRAQKQPNSKQFTNLLIEAYKLVSTTPITENTNLVDLSMKYCQSLIQALKQQATQASLDKSHNAQKKQSAKAAAAAAAAAAETTKTTTATPQPKAAVPAKVSTPTTSSATGLPKISSQEMAAAIQNFMPVLSDPMLSQQTAAALSYLRNMSALASYTQPHQNPLQNALQNTLQNSFQAEFYRQFLTQSFSSYNLPPPPKKKRGPKPGNQPKTSTSTTQMKSKSFSGSGGTMTSVSKSTTTPMSTSLHKSASAPLAPSMGTVLPSLPASMAANLSSFGALSHSHASAVPAQAHMSSASSLNPAIHTKPPMPHQQVSPGKTLQEKLAERQKNLPSMSKSSSEITASISKLPSSLTITKTSVPKQPIVQGKKGDARKALPFGDPSLRRKPITSDEVIVLDDD